MFQLRVPFSAALRRSVKVGKSSLAALLMLGAGGMALNTAAVAQDAPANFAGDPPARVGRLDLVDGSIWYQSADDSQWSPATLNYPVTTGANFWASGNSRAEIEVGESVMRLDQNSVVGIQALDDSYTQLRLAQGAMNFSIGAMPPQPVQIFTQAGEVDLLQPGRYNIDSGTDGNGLRVQVFHGQAQLNGPQGPVRIGEQQSATISGAGQVQMAGVSPSPLDQWAAQRDQVAAAPPPSYIAPQMTGYQDLAQYGAWNQDPTYGEIWYPSTVPANWAPYHDGHWAYVQPWGWTWIDDAPWGFTPFHYGRWVQVGNRWGWYPGERETHPVYAPALVAFIGGGLSLAITAGNPNVGWVPLAPHEAFHPYYRVNDDYVRRVNSGAVRREDLDRVTRQQADQVAITNLANRQAAIVVPRTDFGRRASVEQNAVRVQQDQLRDARIAANPSALPEPQRRAGGGNGARPASAEQAPVSRGAIPAAIQGQEATRGAGQSAAPGTRQGFVQPPGVVSGQAARDEQRRATEGHDRLAGQAAAPATASAPAAAPAAVPNAAQPQQAQQRAAAEQQQQQQRAAAESQQRAAEAARSAQPRPTEAIRPNAVPAQQAAPATVPNAAQQQEAQQRAAAEQQQRAAAESQRAGQAQQAQQAQQQRAAAESQQRSAAEAQQRQAAEQQRAAGEAQQRSAAEAQQRSLAEAQQRQAAQQQRTAGEAQQRQAAEALSRQAAEAQQRAAPQAAQQQAARPAAQPPHPATPPAANAEDERKKHPQ